MIEMMSMSEEDMAGKTEEEISMLMQIKELEKITKIEANILKKIEAYLAGKDKGFASQQADMIEKLEAPGGIAIMAAIGWVFCSVAKQNMGRFLGLEGKIAGVQATSHEIGATVSLLNSAVKLQQAHERSEKGGVMTEQDEAAIMGHGLETMWKMGKYEIETTIRKSCKMLLKDKSSKKKRAQALYDLGQLYKKESARVKKEKGMEKGTFFDFVQKAQADDERNGEPGASSSGTGTTSTTTTSSTTGTTKTKK
jgi:hypothetical protein